MWAVGHNVDIITMSFGLEEEHGGMQKAIIEAYSKNILMFAAASNEGGNRIVTYPARKEQVICIYATDGKGEPYRSNPTPIGNSYRFATLGEGVKSAWPKGLKKGVAPEQRMTGTSFATPIAAGIAACLLEFALVHGMPDNSYSSLRTRQGMQAVFGKLLVDVRKELHYIHPWRLFSESREPLDILLLMKDTLTHSPN
jgi:subtilisin family serine protease